MRRRTESYGQTSPEDGISAIPHHLVLVTNTLDRGGAEAMLVRLAGAMDRQRVRPIVACLRKPGVWGERLIGDGVGLYPDLLRHKYDLAVIRRLNSLLRQYRPACIMPVGSGGDRMFWSTLAGRLTGSPVAVWSHLFPVPEQPEFEWMNRRLYRWVDAFVALGQRHAEALERAAGVPAGRIRVIRNGIDVDTFDQPAARERARSALGLNPEQTAIGLVANLRPIKRIEMFIDAAAQIHRLRPAARFFVVGEGPQRAELQARADRLGLNGDTIVLLGAREDMPALIQALDIACLTSRRECLSVAMLEAMAAARPFVAPRVGSLDEALVDGQTGRFFEPDTAEQLSRVLLELIDAPQERSRLGEQARRKVRAEFRLEQMARAFENLVIELCARKTR